MTVTTIRLPDLRHLLSAQVEAEMTALDLAGDAHETGQISDACAITVAAWWQAPPGPGETFTRLVSHLPVTVEDLLDAIDSATAEAAEPPGRHALALLRDWALTDPGDL